MPDTCPRCGGPLTYANEVDIGVGVMQGGPRGCDACQWVEEDPLAGLYEKGEQDPGEKGEDR